MNKNITLEGQFAIEMAKEAGSIMRQNFKLKMRTETKSDNTPVTITDKKINKLIITEVMRRFPQHDIRAEEGSNLSRRSRYRWICDPVDGTIAFAHGIPTSVFSLSLNKDKNPIMGVVYDPWMDRLFFAELGKGATLNNEKINVSEDRKIKNTVIGISSWKGAQFNLEPFSARLIESGAKVLKLGSITYQGAMVAAGEFSASIHPARMSYDSAALKVIIGEANGKVTDVFGFKQGYNGRINGAIMSNGHIHKALVTTLRVS